MEIAALLGEQEIKLLQQMQSGVTMFEPLMRTSVELTRFQEIARLLLKMEKEGLVYQCFVTEFEIAGASFYDYVE